MEKHSIYSILAAFGWNSAKLMKNPAVTWFEICEAESGKHDPL